MSKIYPVTLVNGNGEVVQVCQPAPYEVATKTPNPAVELIGSGNSFINPQPPVQPQVQSRPSIMNPYELPKTNPEVPQYTQVPIKNPFVTNGYASSGQMPPAPAPQPQYTSKSNPYIVTSTTPSPRVIDDQIKAAAVNAAMQSNPTPAPAYQPPAKFENPGEAPIVQQRPTIQANNTTVYPFTPEEAVNANNKYRLEGKTLPENIMESAPDKQIESKPINFGQGAKPLNTIGHVKEYDYYYVNGKKLFFYPKPVHADLISWLRKAESRYGINVTQLIAEKLGILYTPKDDHDRKFAERINKKFEIKEAEQQQPKLASISNVKMAAGQLKVETIIPPAKEEKILHVQDPQHWENVKKNLDIGATDLKDDSSEDKVITEEHPTENLQVVKPKTREEIEAEDAERNAKGEVMGFPGTPLVDSIRFKNEMPIIKASVESYLNKFPLDADADRQAEDLENKIKNFIKDDVAEIMHDPDAKGLTVKATRTVDHRNMDCFEIEATHLGTPLFKTYLYPDNGEFDKHLEETMDQPEVMFNSKVMTTLFEEWFKDIDTSECTSIEQAKKIINAQLFSKLWDHFKGKITVARAKKEVEDYINTAINFNKKEPEPTPVAEEEEKAPTAESEL